MIGGEIRRFIPLWKIIFPEIDAREKYDFSGGIHLHISLTIMPQIVCYTERQVMI